MKERGMIFNGEMVRAILDGRKTQTRRVVLHQPQRSDILPFLVFPRNKKEATIYPPAGWIYPNGMEQILSLCQFGGFGDRIWVRETWANVSYEFDDDGRMVDYVPDRPAKAVHEKPFGNGYYSGHVIYAADGGFTWCDDDGCVDGRSCWKPAIHMPRWASRITLEITGVRVERLQDISQADAIAEGGPPDHPSFSKISREMGFSDWPRSWFAQTWWHIYGEKNWQANPWVWVIEFKVVSDE